MRMFTPQMLGIETPIIQKLTISAMSRLNDLKQQINAKHQDMFTQLNLKEMDIVLSIFRGERPTDTVGLIYAAKLDLTQSSHIFSRVVIQLGLKYNEDDIQLIHGINPAVAKWMTDNHKPSLIARMKAKL
jgi:hypothetical protein